MDVGALFAVFLETWHQNVTKFAWALAAAVNWQLAIKAACSQHVCNRVVKAKRVR